MNDLVTRLRERAHLLGDHRAETVIDDPLLLEAASALTDLGALYNNERSNVAVLVAENTSLRSRLNETEGVLRVAIDELEDEEDGDERRVVAMALRPLLSDPTPQAKP